VTLTPDHFTQVGYGTKLNAFFYSNLWLPLVTIAEFNRPNKYKIAAVHAPAT